MGEGGGRPMKKKCNKGLLKSVRRRRISGASSHAFTASLLGTKTILLTTAHSDISAAVHEDYTADYSSPRHQRCENGSQSPSVPPSAASSPRRHDARR